MTDPFVELHEKIMRLNRDTRSEDPVVRESLVDSLNRLADMCLALTTEAKQIRQAEADKIIEGI